MIQSKMKELERAQQFSDYKSKSKAANFAALSLTPKYISFNILHMYPHIQMAMPMANIHSMFW